jgi:hypothetical protein
MDVLLEVDRFVVEALLRLLKGIAVAKTTKPKAEVLTDGQVGVLRYLMPKTFVGTDWT